MYKRPGWDEMFLDIAGIIGRRGTCDRGRSGCVITMNNRIISTGYVGAPPGMAHCDFAGHVLVNVHYPAQGVTREHCIRSTHAEINAIVNAARYGIKLDGGTLYCSMVPCPACAKAIASAGIIRVVSGNDYHAADESKEIFSQTGVELVIQDPEVKKYED